MFNNFKKYVRNYFSFSESETNGFLIFIPLLVFILLIPTILKQYLLSTSSLSNPENERLFREWVAESEQKIRLKDSVQYKSEAFDFDPNLASLQEFSNLGFKEHIAQRIVNYRDKGGKFYKKDDLLKIYGISKNRVNELWDNIKISDNLKKGKRTRPKTKLPKDQPILFKATEYADLNEASADSLMKIKGIGAVLSERIVKYRNSLGGFVAPSQLSEVYGLKTEVIKKLLKKYEVKQAKISGVNINSDSIKYLAKHPYISYSLAKVIVAYKEQHGLYHDVDEVRKIKLMNDSLFVKLSPYLLAEIPDLTE